jgi:protein-L-isoaspartate(D-aspartate) O-methyltransferase
MVAEQLVARGIRDRAVLEAMGRIPRHLFVPPELRHMAYRDGPLPLPEGQSISQPYVVARMTQELRLQGGDRILDVGTGSGYQAAVLACLGGRIHSVERRLGLLEQARRNLAAAGVTSVLTRHGDGRLGWPEAAPFDAILVAAVASEAPPALLEQLGEGGRLLMPLRGGGRSETLVRITRSATGAPAEELLPVRFVPLDAGVA